ncbi:unnamed protein product [Symbiodinium necroappetens]|uniref:Uncharacterized protein n=1 Tax=Symbiodinium necroappetens TaxID=1628268 RepID=A0A813C639_9DINO|nr:unnamed protein product [Symbiodinium necroappetens]
MPGLTVTFPAGFHIGGLMSPPSPAAVESVLCTLATRSSTFQSLQPLHQLVPANARRRVTAYLLSHPQFLDAGLVKRIMEEWHGGTTPANSQGVTISTPAGDLRITLASRIVRLLDTAAPASTLDPTVESTVDGNANLAPRTGETPNHDTADLPAPFDPPSVPTESGIPANAESASPSPLPPVFEAESMSRLAPTEEVSTVLLVPTPSPVPLESREVSVPASSPAPAVTIAGLAPPGLSDTGASPHSGDPANVAPMTPPMDCVLTPQLRGVEMCLAPTASYRLPAVLAVFSHFSLARHWSG